MKNTDSRLIRFLLGSFLILSIIISLINATLPLGEWRVYETVRSCPTANHMPPEMGMLGFQQLPNSLNCVLLCLRKNLCRSIMYDNRDNMCMFLDKDFLLCDMVDGIIQTVCELLFLTQNVVSAAANSQPNQNLNSRKD